MAGNLLGPCYWDMNRDADGHREYTIRFKVRAAKTDGPFTILLTPGLPLPGSPWNFFGDYDPWSWCKPTAKITPILGEEQPYTHWYVEQTFGTKPPGLSGGGGSGRGGGGGTGSGSGRQGCHDTSIEDPLLEPQKINGTFVKYSKEVAGALRVKYYSGNELVRTATGSRVDIGGGIILEDLAPLTNSSWEPIVGQAAEFDHVRHSVTIEQNVPALQLDLWAPMLNCVNDAPLWGLAERCIKFSSATWDKKHYGTCYPYYTRKFEFDIDPNTFDKTIKDEGTMARKGHWGRGSGPNGWEGYNWVLELIGGFEPNAADPSHFVRVRDRNNEVARLTLDGRGTPVAKAVDLPGTGSDEAATEAGSIVVEYYDEANLLLLGIPTILG